MGGEGKGWKMGLTVGVGGGIWQEGRASSSSNSTGEAGDSPAYTWDIFCPREKVMGEDVDCAVIQFRCLKGVQVISGGDVEKVQTRMDVRQIYGYEGRELFM